jgi:hypothetical protein
MTKGKYDLYWNYDAKTTCTADKLDKIYYAEQGYVEFVSKNKKKVALWVGGLVAAMKVETARRRVYNNKVTNSSGKRLKS